MRRKIKEISEWIRGNKARNYIERNDKEVNKWEKLG